MFALTIHSNTNWTIPCYDKCVSHIKLTVDSAIGCLLTNDIIRYITYCKERQVVTYQLCQADVNAKRCHDPKVFPMFSAHPDLKIAVV